MAIYVNTIIARALRIIRAERAFQSENYSARTYALEVLNGALSLMNPTGSLIPFNVQFLFNLVPGKAEYVVGANAEIETNPFSNIEYVNIRVLNYIYPVTIQDDFNILKNTITPAVQGRPVWVRISPSDEALTFQFLPTPERVYECQLWGKRKIAEVAYQDALDLPRPYAELLVYEVARGLNSQEGLGTWSELNEKEYMRIRKILLSAAAQDMRIRSKPPIRHYNSYYSYNLGVVDA